VKLTLRRKVIILVLFAALVPVIVTQIGMLGLQANLSAATEAELDTLGRDALKQIVDDMHSLCTTSNDLIQEKVDRALKVAWQIVGKDGGFRFANDKAEWTAVDQFSKKSTKVELPRLMVGDKWLGQTTSFETKVPVVDDIKSLMGVVCSIFQRMDEKGDMVRVATTVSNAGGARAIGTFIPSTRPDGTRDPIVEAVLSGNPYKGMAWAAGSWFITSYDPIVDPKGQVVGMFVVGELIEAVPSLRKNIQSVTVGETGVVTIFGATGDRKGRYIITHDGKKEGESAWFEKDANGGYYLQKLVTDAVKTGEPTFHTFPWIEPGSDKEARRKIAVAYYFPDWDWVIVASTYEDEYYEAKTTIDSVSSSFTRNMLLLAFGIVALTVIAAWYFSNKITDPITGLIGGVEKIANGDLKKGNEEITKYEEKQTNLKIAAKFLKIEDNDESHLLVSSVKRMAANLFSLISQVGSSGFQVNSSVNRITASARELEATVAEQAASIKEVTATTQEILQTSNTLLETMEESIGGSIAHASKTAEEGRGDLRTLEEAIHRLIDATKSISAKLSVINSRADKISTVVVTINKISDQTNLLSLNAAIEAEKAGEFGKGFSVVAREISRLADQTAVATHDIEHMVKEMLSSVSAGVMEMDKFSEEVRMDSITVSNISERLNDVINSVNELAPHFDEMNDGMRRQTAGAGQINEAMQQLSVAAEQTKDSLQEFRSATGQLNNAVNALNEEIQKFKV